MPALVIFHQGWISHSHGKTLQRVTVPETSHYQGVQRLHATFLVVSFWGRVPPPNKHVIKHDNKHDTDKLNQCHG